MSYLKIFSSVIFSLIFACGALFAQNSSRQYAVLIGGLGGTQEHREKFRQYLYETRNALIERCKFPEENISVLAESPIEKYQFIEAISNADNIRAKLSGLSNKLTTDDELYIFLFGHGSFDGKNAMLNIPRRDLKDSDYAALLQSFHAGTIIFINTSSCSGPFINRLSAANRIIITATKSGTERNETIFPQFLIEALQNMASDRDKNGMLSVLETFLYASERTAGWYKEKNHLATEHPLLEDTGDKTAYREEELSENGEGGLSSVTYLLRRAPVPAVSIAGSSDSTYQRLILELDKVNREIDLLKAKKGQYPEDEYFAKLEKYLLQLARINEQIETYDQKQ
jgi:hypothetical protein